jgi:hypothetical protein
MCVLNINSADNQINGHYLLSYGTIVDAPFPRSKCVEQTLCHSIITLEERIKVNLLLYYKVRLTQSKEIAEIGAFLTGALGIEYGLSYLHTIVS